MKRTKAEKALDTIGYLQDYQTLYEKLGPCLNRLK
jgi:hypothetical protein